jgi:serine/threonine-protein kinase
MSGRPPSRDEVATRADLAEAPGPTPAANSAAAASTSAGASAGPSVIIHTAGAEAGADAAVATQAGDEEIVHSPTIADSHDGIPTRRESDDTRDQLDEKIRAHLDRAEAKKDPLIGQMVGGRFLVVKKIGSGGMGSVYRARQEGMDRDVAIKVLLADLTQNDTVLRRFTLEALAVSRLRHPNTIQIFDYGQTLDGNPYIAMEMLEGQTLYDLLRKERPLPVRRAMRIMAQAAASLAEAHGKEIVHRDLKPENIFLVKVGDNEDYVKVLDFGVAKLRDHKGDAGTLTQAGSIFGTPRYMSPEQCSAQPVDARSDLYSLGIILYEMITGQAPFVADQGLALLLAHVNDTPRPPSAATDKQVIPAEVEDLVLKLLEKLPEHRLETAGELAKRCEELAAQLPAAFDQCVGTAEEAQSLGVRVSTMTAEDSPTSRTLRIGGLPADKAAGAPQLVMEAPAKSSAAVKVGVGVVLIAAIGAVAWALSRPPDVVVKTQVIKEQVTVTVPGAALDDQHVRLTVNSNPPGAKILRGDVLLGTTNATLDHAKSKGKERWTLIRDGYEPHELEVALDQSQVLSIELKKRIELPVNVPPVAKPEPGHADPRPAGKPAPAKPEAAKAEAKPATEPAVEPAKPQVSKPAVAADPKPEPKVEPKKKKDDLLDDLQ